MEHGEAHACITEDNLTTLISPSTVWVLQRNLKLPNLEANAFGWGISPPLMHFWGGKSEDPQSFLIQRHCDVDSLRWCWDLGFSLNPHISCYRETHSSSFSGLMYTWVCVCVRVHIHVCTNVRAWVGQRLWLLFLRYNPPYFSESVLSLTRTCQVS